MDRPAEVTGALQLTVWRGPIEDELLTTDDTDAEPIVSPHFHIDLLDWATYRAFSGKDAETQDDSKATAAARSFDAKVGRLPSATEIRLWGVSRLVGTTAEFL